MNWIFSYLIKDYTRHLYAGFRHLVLMTSVVATTIFLAALTPTFVFEHSAAFSYAAFDGHINGPITESTANALKRLPEMTRTGIMSGGGGDVMYGTRQVQAATVSFYKDAGDLDMTWYSQPLLISGRRPKQGEWAVDWTIARNLKIKPGDRIATKINFASSGKDYRQSGVVVGIYAPTKQTNRSVILPMTDELKQILDKQTDGAIYSDFFFKSEALPAVSQFLQAKTINEGMTLIARQQGILEGKKAVDEFINPFLQTGATYVAMITFLFFILREQWVRIERRRKNLAILLALGIRRWQIIALNLVEQLCIAFATTLAGLWVGRLLMEGVFFQYLPAQISSGLIAIIFALNILVLGLSIAQISLKIRYLPVAKLLAQE